MRKESDPRDKHIAILGCFFLSGAAGLVYQVAWAKALGLIFGHTVYAAAVVPGYALPSRPLYYYCAIIVNSYTNRAPVNILLFSAGTKPIRPLFTAKISR